MNNKHYLAIILVCLVFSHHLSSYAQTNEQKLSKISSAVNDYINNKKKDLLTPDVVNKADVFIYSVSNASLYEDTPYTITVSDGFVSVCINTLMGEFDRSFPISPDKFEHFKKELIKSRVRLEKNEYADLLDGTTSTTLSVMRNHRVLFEGNTLDSDSYLTSENLLDDVFWELVPVSFEELIDPAATPADDPISDPFNDNGLFNLDSF